MNCLTEAIGLALPGNGTTLATHVARRELFQRAAALQVYATLATPASTGAARDISLLAR